VRVPVDAKLIPNVSYGPPGVGPYLYQVTEAPYTMPRRAEGQAPGASYASFYSPPSPIYSFT
jgi:hypothetical protein